MKLSCIIDSKTWMHCLKFWVILTYLSVCHATDDILSNVFRERTVCGVKQRLEDGCLRLVISSTPISRVQCAAWCEQNATAACLGIVVNQTGSCYFNHGCGALETTATCSGEDAFFTAYDKPNRNVTSPCHNSGVWLEGSQQCLCGPYTSGSLCENVPESCEDLRNWGLPNGIHVVDMNVLGNPVLAKVKCELGSNFVYTHVSHNNGTSNYNATFQEYKDGFYKGHSAFWLGLENMNRLTENGVEEFVILILINGVESKKIYHDFEVEEESDDYEVDFNTWTAVGSNMGRCLTRDTPFSTWDRDRDARTSLNIAKATGIGWWFVREDTRFCNLNGLKPLDNSNNLNYISAEWIDLSLAGSGNTFESTTMYLEQTFP